MRYALLLTVAVVLPSLAAAQAPTYQRLRTGADDWQMRGGSRQHWRGPRPGFGGFFDPFWAPPPIVATSWYQRPYPYHFDYYRHRWGGPQQGYADDPAAADCPCAVPPPVEVIE